MSTSTGITIVKASGERDVFSESKLRESLKRSGAGDKAIDRVVAVILNELYEGMPTRKIYR
ncbi:MAG: ATPase, partial [Cyclonatronaceae bacterium]